MTSDQLIGILKRDLESDTDTWHRSVIAQAIERLILMQGVVAGAKTLAANFGEFPEQEMLDALSKLKQCEETQDDNG